LKKIDKFILKSFAGPYILSFFIAEFVLIMQFLWKYIDDILGKGFGILEVLELIMYNALQMIPLALPISILLASVMVFGDISEKYELSSFKSSGISLLRVMRSAIGLSVLTCLFSILASNYIKPTATYQFKKRFDLIRRQKTTLAIEEGIFNNEFQDIVIRVGKKDENNIDMKDALIYDHSMQDRSLVNMIKSDSAKMYSSDDGNYFFMSLKNGIQVQELDRTPDGTGVNKFPMIRTSFKTWDKVIDMSGFYLSESDIFVSKDREDMLNTFQILEQIDSINVSISNTKKANRNDYFQILDRQVLDQNKYDLVIKENQITENKQNEVYKRVDTIARKEIVKNDGSLNTENGFNKQKDIVLKRLKAIREENQKEQVKKEKFSSSSNIVQNQELLDRHYTRRGDKNVSNVKNFYELFDSLTIKNMCSKAVPFISSNLDKSTGYTNDTNSLVYRKEALLFRLSQHYSFAIVCILFLFIGAPLGSIIRKGGYGYPLLISITFYIVFIITTIIGDKLLKGDKISGMMGGWMPCIILLPFSIFFTYKALRDSNFSGTEKIEKFLHKLYLRLTRSKDLDGEMT
jgi:lipopolysaccharide export system permease protein